ncbi:hypothetical protein V5799_026724 [Amblyomma americanum]|uniref:Peptidase M13 C-terminal domain-containing protein n=1 Tax=Amblyomma americanum TaxID=6943 RepID=A0AAQ4DHR7_AMBAM
MNDVINDKVQAMLSKASVPERRQNAFQKAVAMYRACVSLRANKKSEAVHLRDFLSRLGLNPASLNLSRDPLDAMMLFSNVESEWYRERQDYEENGTYTTFVEKILRFLLLNETDSFVGEITENITSVETKVVNFILDEFEDEKKKNADSLYLIKVKDVPKYLDNVVTSGRWESMILRHSDRKYRMSDRLVLEPLGAKLTVFMLDELKRAEALLIISWSVMRQVAPYADGSTHEGTPRQTRDACYQEVRNVLEAALVSKVIYKKSSFVLSWMNASRFLRRVQMKHQGEILFTLGWVNAQYTYATNTVNLAGALLQPVIFYHGAPAGYNYGGIGQLIGHEMMHAFDVVGRQANERGMRTSWWPKQATEKYLEQTSCLRNIHREALRKRALVLNHTVDSENLADVMGIRMAFDALQNLTGEATRVKFKVTELRSATTTTVGDVAGFTDHQLFFIGHCAKPDEFRSLDQQIECDNEGCRQLRLFLLSTINKSADPCRDFFSFTCAAKLEKERMSLMAFSSVDNEWYRDHEEHVKNKSYESLVEGNLSFLFPKKDGSFIKKLKANITSAETKSQW